jgi:rSAM/selenodomain-associated transferase 2
MTITVVIPVYNEETILPRRLSHTAALGFDDIVVVDGGSTDRSIPLAQAFCSRVPNAALVSAPRGRARQMNEGVKASRGDVLLFLHADTELPHNARHLVEHALTDPGVVGGRFDVRFDSSSLWASTISRLMNLRSRWSGIATGDQGIFVRRAVFDRLGGFADIPLMEDVDFSRRLKRS